MPDALTPQEAAARLEPTDTLGIPLGTGQPPAFMAALGERDDWADLRIYGALLLAWSEAFRHPHVHYLSGLLRAGRARAARPGRQHQLRPGRLPPLRAAARAAGAAGDGHGRRAARRRRAGAASRCTPAARSRSWPAPAPTPIGCWWSRPRRTFPAPTACGRTTRTRSTSTRSTCSSSSEAEPFALPEPEPGEVDAAIAEHARRFIADGSTLQTGIGTIPSAIVGRLAEGGGGDYGVHSEMFTNGLMRLHEAGKVSNRKGQFDGVSVATFAGGSPELYAWLEGNEEVAFLPVEVVNSQDLIARNRMMVTINAALAVDIHGQVVADTIAGSQYSGIGGHEDFIAGPALSLSDRALLCLPSTVDGRRRAALADRALVRRAAP